MDLAEWSRAGLLGIIIVKNRANRLDGRPSEGERLADAGLLAHNVREERRGRGGNGGNFWGIYVERGADGVRGGTVRTIG
jgi:hypothetical protein